MKEYRKLLKQIRKNKAFELIKTTRKSTVKLKHISSGDLYSIHPGDNAVKPLRKWIKNKENEDINNR